MTTGPSDASRAEAAARLPDRIAFLGLGLIGGSIALALREAGSTAHLAAWTPAGAGPREGLSRGVIDSAAASVAEALDGAGLVVLAGPPLSVLHLVGELAGPLRAALAGGATVTDVASTKALIVDLAAASGLPFVGGHPMAGRESSGVGAATPALFVERPWVVVPTPASRPVDVERVRDLAVATGARPIELAADAHDEAVAGISHLPLVLAAALAESVAGSAAGAPTWPLARSLAATGWTDMTRLARGDPEMGAGILTTNAHQVAKRLRALREVVDGWIDALDAAAGGDDDGALRAELLAARDALGREPPS